MTCLIPHFQTLPDELIHIILQYTNKVLYRNGKYINRIDRGDARYLLVRSIPRPVFSGNNRVYIKLTNIDYRGYFIRYDIQGRLVKMNIRFFHREMDGFDSYYEIKSNDSYVFDANHQWRKLVDYSM